MAFDIFAKVELSQYLRQRLAEMNRAVQAEPADYILNVNEEEYVQHLVDQYQVEPLEMRFEGVYVSAREEMIPAERHPRAFIVTRGASCPKQVITYHIPYSGTEQLLHCIPNPRIRSTHEVELRDNCISFDVIDFYQNADQIKREAEPIANLIKGQLEHVTANVAEYNSNLPREVGRVVSSRRKQLLDQQGVVASLGLPIRKSSNVPETFAIPTVRKKVILKPTVPPTGTGVPEPTIDQAVYEDILKTIQDMGRVFERLPNVYAGKDEEALRDHLIMQLEPRFEGSTTGETFNKSGKTDILMRHEGKNVFVAECKFWGGSAAHSKTIDQILGYLTWRDSKTAIVCFVDRKDFTAVLNEIAAFTAGHPCCVKHVHTTDETWQNFEFHLPGDSDRRIKLAVLAFHLPRN